MIDRLQRHPSAPTASGSQRPVTSVSRHDQHISLHLLELAGANDAAVLASESSTDASPAGASTSTTRYSQ